MKETLVKKYKAFTPVDLPGRKWPNNPIVSAPQWCSVDLRDGNQALILPMSPSEKLEMFELLLETGFKQIEVGFPSASETEYAFLRGIIENNQIPEDVVVQVLTQARKHLIMSTFNALKGAKKAILHLYNSTSTLQRDVVFRMDKKQIKELAVEGVKLVKELSKDTDTEIILQYSPESFTGTETDYAVEVCEAVMDVWQPTEQNKIILNLPATVEMSSPNYYADQIEWFCNHLNGRDKAIISLHAHNDRGTAVAATELALMAGGDRVEGTLFGNGERTGNVDIINVALNMFTQGINPKLNLSDIQKLIVISEKCTKIPVGKRHPYAGELVYTAFSGSHQDAIKKGMDKQSSKKEGDVWGVPYLPIDPSDLGRSYEAIIRINSQSGKGGVAYLLETEYGCHLPKKMHPEISIAVQKVADKTGKEISSSEIWSLFEQEYLHADKPFKLLKFKSTQDKKDDKLFNVDVVIENNGKEMSLQGEGNGPIDACKHALKTAGLADFSILSYSEHSLNQGSDSKAVSYIQIENEQELPFFGAGIDSNINLASIKALFSAINRSKA